MIYQELTVILLNYNYSQFIRHTIESLLRQSYSPGTFIIIDDCSTDNSQEIILEYKKNSNINIVPIFNKKNLGIIENCNIALNMVKTKYVFFAASDDIYYQNLFKESIELLNSNVNAAFCSTLSDIIDINGKINGECYAPIISKSKKYLSPSLCSKIIQKEGPWFLGNTRIFNSQILKNHNGFDGSLASLSDSFISIILATQYGVCFIPKKLAALRMHEQCYSHTINTNTQNVKNYLFYAENLLIKKYNKILTNKFINITITRWKLTATLNILKINPKISWVELFPVIPKINNIKKSIIYILFKLKILKITFLSSIILYLLVRPYDIYRRLIRKFKIMRTPI